MHKGRHRPGRQGEARSGDRSDARGRDHRRVLHVQHPDTDPGRSLRPAGAPGRIRKARLPANVVRIRPEADAPVRVQAHPAVRGALYREQLQPLTQVARQQLPCRKPQLPVLQHQKAVVLQSRRTGS